MEGPGWPACPASQASGAVPEVRSRASQTAGREVPSERYRAVHRQAEGRGGDAGGGGVGVARSIERYLSTECTTTGGAK
jgi:hypothetical protein